MKKNFGLTYKQDKPDSFQIKIKQLVIADKSNVATGKNNTVNTGVVSEPKQMSYLLDRVMKLETDLLSKDRENSINIQINQLVNIVGNNSNVAGKNIDVISEPKQMSYLLDRVMKLETDLLSKDRETEKLKDEIKLLKKKK